MKAFIVADGELRSGLSEALLGAVREFLLSRKYEIEEAVVDRGDVKPCMGCFGCWVKKPGECVIGDRITAINRSAMTSDAVFYLCPVVFGQFSANMKNVIDRWLPNMLPFFITRPDGSTMHPPRYKDYPSQVMIGYADDLMGEDAQLFTDITKKHRSNAEVLIYRDSASLLDELGRLQLSRIGGQL